eukprot:1339667-Amorphochlora_amoeboformis.AAC.2
MSGAFGGGAGGQGGGSSGNSSLLKGLQSLLIVKRFLDQIQNRELSEEEKNFQQTLKVTIRETGLMLIGEGDMVDAKDRNGLWHYAT